MDIDDAITTEHAVHLVIRVRDGWDSAREELVAEVEARTRAATAYAASPAFKQRFGTRIGVVRVQSPSPAPSIVSHLLTEQGIELEDLSAEHPADGETCVFCNRQKLRSDEGGITDSGYACPSCLRAWSVKTQPDLLRKPRSFRIPPRLFWPLLIAAIALFAFGVYYELTRLNTMNRVIRMHVPQ